MRCSPPPGARFLFMALASLAALATSNAHAERVALNVPMLPTLSAPDVDVTVATAESPEDGNALPDAPEPQNPAQQSTSRQTTAKQDSSRQIDRQQRQATTPGFPPVSPRLGLQLPQAARMHPEIPSGPSVCLADVSTTTPSEMSCARKFDAFQRFVDSNDIHPLTARQKGILALRNTVDPYNFATISFLSGVAVASDPNSPYGPGFPGFARNFGVAYCETAVSEFFGTFLIPAVTHQDPHYHRMPNAPYPRRILHAITQVAWAQDDFGTPMPNYSVLVTTAVADGLSNLYVPGRRKDWGSAVTRYSTAIATDPIGNFVTEFLPDVARRVNVRIVLIQRVIDRVERGSESPR